ncbi:MAG TPA: HAMP domain-containing protein [Acidimicrobiia bacterium]|jgi:signal transduction histidine kinase
MRGRLALVSLAVTTLVVLAFIIPLATLVKNQAEARALQRAETDAQSIATTLAITTASRAEVTPDLAQAVIEAFRSRQGVTIIFPDGTSIGAPFVGSPNLDEALRGAAFTARTEGGAEVLVPVLTADTLASADTVVVRTFVTDAELRRGVTVAWLMLGGLGLFLITVAALAADRLARSVVRPVTALSDAARALGGGDLSVRVMPSGPAEVADTGEAFNYLAGRLRDLLSAERESVADLSHRLRTPLTALRLQAETLTDPLEAAGLLEDIDAMERAVDRMIEEARRPTEARQPAGADLASVVRHRATFWKILADEQGRPAAVHTTGGQLRVALDADELGALIDTLIENVFSHTGPGVGYSVEAKPGPNGLALLVVEDKGDGFAVEGATSRGKSGGGSTGLGLDIALRAAQRTGGDLVVGNRPGGGGRVEVTFGRTLRPSHAPPPVQTTRTR